SVGSYQSSCSPQAMLGGRFRSVSAGCGRDFGFDRPEQAIEVEGPIVTPLVDEERRSAVHAAANASLEVLSNPGGVDVLGQVPDEAGTVKTEGRSVPDQVFIAECLLVFEQYVVHGPEPPLRSGRLRGLCRTLGMWVDRGQREIPEDEAY